ncbi:MULTISPECIES: hypothetical protein [unclassified Thermoplasma]|uniref:hypothetical protein n=1 Tax=unclassified Thermoplasma TaxID=2684908 RepID=UPI000D887E98|nr:MULTISPECIES: hypothetical protein [unclassified Thermoplasma]PYB68987.1 hypothetical protein DMB44_01160 [Thermoplasma sp. Kam2015]
MDIDIKKILKMNKKDQSAAMLEIFNGLLGKNVDEIASAMKDMIMQVDKVGTDAEYIGLCETNLTLVRSLPDATAKKVIEARLKAQKELPEKQKNRDASNLTKALNNVDKDGKIASLIKTLS